MWLGGIFVSYLKKFKIAISLGSEMNAFEKKVGHLQQKTYESSIFHHINNLRIILSYLLHDLHVWNNYHLKMIKLMVYSKMNITWY